MHGNSFTGKAFLCSSLWITLLIIYRQGVVCVDLPRAAPAKDRLAQ
jgi:hypothetical protein